MGLLVLEYPRLSVSVELPDQLLPDFRRNFSFAIASRPPQPTDLEYQIRLDRDGARLMKNRAPIAAFSSTQELMFSLEEEIENSLIERLDEWVGFHAGAAVLHDAAIVIVGRPDTGKTTTTFQLVELGLELLCEEVTPVDPAKSEVHPFPQVLTLARSYAEEFRARYPVTGGTLSFPELPAMARYTAGRIRTQAVPLGAIVFPAFDPTCEPRLEEVLPAQVLTDLLQHCFPPALGDERLYDDVIRLIERSRLFRLRSCCIESARGLLSQLIARLP